jgi:hypothetical protein
MITTTAIVNILLITCFYVLYGVRLLNNNNSNNNNNNNNNNETVRALPLKLLPVVSQTTVRYVDVMSSNNLLQTNTLTCHYHA